MIHFPKFQALCVVLALSPFAGAATIHGAWQIQRSDGATGVWIVADQHFSIAWYRKSPAKFVSTEGGRWQSVEGGVRLQYEYDTADPSRVGTKKIYSIGIQGRSMMAGDSKWTRIDDGTPGALEGSWLMTGRKRDGEITTRVPGARRTMKILSGTRFQWIAYNVETKEFFGTGGGTYSTADGKYTERIEFFSRDDARSGQSLEFTFELIDGSWHHAGKSTAGEPMHEVWERRKKLNI